MNSFLNTLIINMRVCITKPDMELLFLELDDGATGEDVKVFIEIETGFTVDTQALFF